MLKAIVFDLDDTLYPEESYVFSGFRAVARWIEMHYKISFEIGYSQLVQLFQDGVRGSTFNEWLKLNNLEDEHLVQTLVNVYRNHHPELLPYPDVTEVLPTLSRRFKLGLVSDGFLNVQQKKWKALELKQPFSGVVFSDQWGRDYWKPNQRPFKEVLRLCDSDSSEAVYIGDNPKKDFLGAKQLGMYTIRIKRKKGIYSEFEPPSPEYAPHIEIFNLNQLKNFS
ncbi:putative hydrolase of the HAD superfamily [Candidatus Magnetomoraceae bacterium gMMP-15]